MYVFYHIRSYAMIVSQLTRRVIDNLYVIFYVEFNKSDKNTIQIDGEVN